MKNIKIKKIKNSKNNIIYYLVDIKSPSKEQREIGKIRGKYKGVYYDNITNT